MLLVVYCAFSNALVLPIAPAVGAAAVGVAALLGAKKTKEERDAFLGMKWFGAPEQADEDGCYVLGEEQSGKTWYVCNEPNQDKRMECEPVDGMGNPNGADDQYLCKEKKPVSDNRGWNPFGSS